MGSGFYGGIFYGQYSVGGTVPPDVLAEPSEHIVIAAEDRTIAITDDRTILPRFDDRIILTPNEG